MRASLYLSAFCAVTFACGAAFAEPHRAQQPREPASIERVLRSHGEMVDRFRSPPSAKIDRSDRFTSPMKVDHAKPNTQLEARRKCSDDAECGSSTQVASQHHGSSARGGGPWAAAAKKSEKSPTDRYSHASERRNCFGDECRVGHGKIAHEASSNDPTKRGLSNSAKAADKAAHQDRDASARSEKKSQASMSPAERATAKKVLAFIESKICAKNIDLCGHGGGNGGSESR